MMSRRLRLMILAACLLMAGRVSAATYYVDNAGGNDSNNGTSKSTPWQHAPGMQSCVSACASTAIHAGDSIILKGGVTWPSSSFNWAVPSSSTNGDPVYVGVDKTWYAGSSFARPILDAGRAVITNNNNVMINVPKNVTFDGFEIIGYYWNMASCDPVPSCAVINMGQTTGQTVSNLYVHGWSHAGTNSSSNNGVAIVILHGTGGNSIAHDNVIVGTDNPGDHSVTAFYGGPPVAYNNFCKTVASCFITAYQTSVHDNHIEDVGPAYCNMPSITNCTHENGFEDNGDTGLNFYNNTIQNIGSGLALWVAPNPGYTVNMWNNVIYAVHDNQVLDFAHPVYNANTCSTGMNSQSYCNTTGNYVFNNNTVQCGDDSRLYDGCQNVGFAGGGSFNYQNNHFITATTAKGCKSGVANCNFAASNVVQTLATANSQGYSSSQTFAFSPTSSGDATVKAGTSLTSLALGLLATLSSDTTYACGLGSGNQPSCPRRATSGHPLSGGWDAGAYQFGGSTANNTPTNLTVTSVQ